MKQNQYENPKFSLNSASKKISQKYLSKLDHLKLPETVEKEEEQPVVEYPKAEEKTETVEDFLNDIKSAANRVVLEQNFIYEPTSGKDIS